MVLLEVENLTVSYRTDSRTIQAVRGLSLQIAAGESLALVGETASGKSTVALALMGLLNRNAEVEDGKIRFQGVPLSFRESRSWVHLRGSKIGMVFQDARGALNPVLTIGSQLVAALRAHQRLSPGTARKLAASILSEAGIPDPAFFMKRYPIELSGGMCQRVGIAAAVSNRPALLIADEPTSALDPSIQAQILELLRILKDRYDLAVLLISHDLALVAEISQRVAVMYCGRLVESGPAVEIFRRPAHPYTSSLIACQADLRHRWDQHPLTTIAGSPPAGVLSFQGCAFVPRCPKAGPDCARSDPPARFISGDHWAACFTPNADSSQEH
jgi:oligopeptide/dipeptide ABC transporter ATP-binding protein